MPLFYGAGHCEETNNVDARAMVFTMMRRVKDVGTVLLLAERIM